MKLNGFQKVFLLFHLLFLVVCYLIYASSEVEPSTFPYFGFIAIGFPLLVFVDLCLIAYWLFAKWRYAILFIILSAGLYIPLSKNYQYFGKKTNTKSDLKIISYNVKYLRTNGIGDFFKKENADVIALQEVYTRQINPIKDSLFKGYYHESYSLLQFFSKYPIIETKSIVSNKDGASGRAAYFDVDTGKDTIRFINVYLESMFLDKKLIEETAESEKTEENAKVIKNKLVHGFIEHEKQIKKIIPYIRGTKHPVILMGDFNSVPNSYEYNQIANYLTDAYTQVGRSSGNTFYEYKIPIKLDYIFYSSTFLPVSIESKNVKYSDHYPVIATFKSP